MLIDETGRARQARVETRKRGARVAGSGPRLARPRYCTLRFTPDPAMSGSSHQHAAGSMGPRHINRWSALACWLARIAALQHVGNMYLVRVRLVP